MLDFGRRLELKVKLTYTEHQGLDLRLEEDNDAEDEDLEIWDQFEQQCAFVDEDEDIGPEWMFEPQEKPVKDPNYSFCPAPHRRGVLRLFTKHFLQHPLLPDQCGKLTPKEIYEKAAFEMYLYCKQRGLTEVWAYLWTSWYQPKQWCLWARSASKQSKPRLDRIRTTMTAENFHQQLKHQFLHHIHRPRLDHTIIRYMSF